MADTKQSRKQNIIAVSDDTSAVLARIGESIAAEASSTSGLDIPALSRARVVAALAKRYAADYGVTV